MTDNPSDPVAPGSIPQSERPAAPAADRATSDDAGSPPASRPVNSLPPRTDRIAAITGTVPVTPKSARNTGAVPVTRSAPRTTGAVPVTRDDGPRPPSSPSPSSPNPASPGPASPGPAPGVTGVILLPGLAVWRRTPIIGALLFIAGVIAPAFAMLMVIQNRDDLVGLFTRANILRGIAIVAVAGITSRIIAVFLTADRLADSKAATAMRRRGSAAVLLLAIPTTFAVIRMEQTRSVVQEVFGQDSDTGAVTAAGDQRAEEYHTVLMMGSDEGNDRLGLRTDTMILAMVHQPTGHTALVSVPRNLASLQFPPDSPMGQKYPNGYDDLINAVYETVELDPELKAAYTDGVTEPGIRGLMEGLSYSLGISIDDYVIVNSCAFVKLVDALGGVTITLDKELPMPAMLRCSNYRLPLTIGPGETYMDGTKALGYVRSRKADSDYQRMERQRILLETISAKIGIGTLLTNFSALADIVKDEVRTSMTVEEARTLLAFLQVDDGSFESVGLVPPIVKPGDPDYPKLQGYMRSLRDNVAVGQPAPVVTDTTGVDETLNEPTETTG